MSRMSRTNTRIIICGFISSIIMIALVEAVIEFPASRVSRARQFWNISYEEQGPTTHHRQFGREIYPFPEGSMFSVSISIYGPQ